MKMVKIEVKVIVGSKRVRVFSSEARCCTESDTYPLFRSVKEELDIWKRSKVIPL